MLRIIAMIGLTLVPIHATQAQQQQPQQQRSTRPMNTYEATIRLPGGGQTRVTVQSDNTNHARQQLEMQYGRGNVMNLHQTSR